jgi:DtxR family Mn-dependent transcriptional regulator
MLSPTEENYLKAIYKIIEKTSKPASTKSISEYLKTSPASVTEMLKRLDEKSLILYQKYKGVRLKDVGIKRATELIRKHRLWEVFLVEKLNFSWDEIHPIAEHLEHIQSEKLTNALDSYLGHPKFDPHGDPIPNEFGEFEHRDQVLLSEVPTNNQCILVGVREHSKSFLRQLEALELVLGAKIEIEERFEFDQSMKVKVNHGNSHLLSNKLIGNLYVQVD